MLAYFDCQMLDQLLMQYWFAKINTTSYFSEWNESRIRQETVLGSFFCFLLFQWLIEKKKYYVLRK